MRARAPPGGGPAPVTQWASGECARAASPAARGGGPGRLSGTGVGVSAPRGQAARRPLSETVLGRAGPAGALAVGCQRGVLQGGLDL